MPRSLSTVESDPSSDINPVEARPDTEEQPPASHEESPSADQIVLARFSLARQHHHQQAEIARDQVLALNLSDAERSRLQTKVESHDRASQICQWLEDYCGHRKDQNQLAIADQNEANNWDQQLKIYDGSSSLASLWRGQDGDYKKSVDRLYDPEALETICDTYWEIEEIDVSRDSLIEQEMSRYASNRGGGPDEIANRSREVEAHYEKLIRDKRQLLQDRLRHLQEGHDEADRRLLGKITGSRLALEFLANPDPEISSDGVAGHFANLLEIQACAQSQEGDDGRTQELQDLARGVRRSAENLARPDQDHERTASQLLDSLWQYQVSSHQQLIPEEDRQAVAEILEHKTGNADKIDGLANYWILLLKAHLKTYLGGINETKYGVSAPNEMFDDYEPVARDLRTRISQVENLKERLGSPGNDNRADLGRFATALLTDFTQDMHACISINADIEPHECSNCSATHTDEGLAYSLPHPTKTDASLSLA